MGDRREYNDHTEPNWDGRERRRDEHARDLDWHQNKLKILGDLDDLKIESKETKNEVQKISNTLIILQTKIGIMVAGISLVISTVVGIGASFIGGK
jgi:hypothetical protein